MKNNCKFAIFLPNHDVCDAFWETVVHLIEKKRKFAQSPQATKKQQNTYIEAIKIRRNLYQKNQLK